MAETILADYDRRLKTESAVVDVEHLAEVYLELEMDYQDLSNNGSVLGMMVFGDSPVPVYDGENDRAKEIWAHEGTIIIDNSLLLGRQIRRGRFTVGHEVAHWLLHRPYFSANAWQLSLLGQWEQSFVRCRQGDIGARRRQLVTDDDWMEWQADSFSSALLMPKQAFIKIVQERFRLVGIEGGCYVWGTDGSLDLWTDYLSREMADLFEVSLTAARIRLENLGLIRKKDEEVGLVHGQFKVW
jgi:Zn-dependent peptidase ImmA (M78 family)